jgi:hypothetical protein
MPYLDTVQLAAGDYNPQLNFTLKDANTGDPSSPATWSAIDLSSALKVVKVLIYLLGSSTLLAEITCTKVGGGSTGQVYAPAGSYQFAAAGTYVADIKLYEDSKPVTVYDQVRFKVRE